MAATLIIHKATVAGRDSLQYFWSGVISHVSQRQALQIFTAITFIIYTHYIPLVYALHSKPDHHSPREIRHLIYISQFTTDIRNVKGLDNVVADALSHSHIDVLHTSSSIDYNQLAADQENDVELPELRD